MVEPQIVTIELVDNRADDTDIPDCELCGRWVMAHPHYRTTRQKHIFRIFLRFSKHFYTLLVQPLRNTAQS